MSISVKNSNGDWVQCAGQGRAEYGASTVRTGTVTIPATNGKTLSANCTVSFSSPMPDTDYMITFESNDNTGGYFPANIWNKSVNGCLASFFNGNNGDQPAVSVRYTAFKLYTDTEYNKILESLPVVDSVTDEDMHAVTSNAVYDYLAGSPLIGQITTTLGVIGYGEPADKLIEIKMRLCSEITNNPLGTAGQCLYIRIGVVEFIIGALSTDGSQWAPGTRIAYRVRHGNEWQPWNLLTQD